MVRFPLMGCFLLLDDCYLFMQVRITHIGKYTHQTATSYTGSACKRFFVIIVSINPQSRLERYHVFVCM